MDTMPDWQDSDLKEQPRRSRPNENHLLINAFAPRDASPLVSLATLGQEVCAQMLAQGSWDAIAKLESALARMEREDGTRMVYFRTALREAQGNALPYIVEVTAADKPGVLYQLAEFFEHHGVSIENMSCSRYRAAQTGADVFSAQFTVGIPVDTHIAGLRDDFLEFCDGLNLDAILDPMKF